MGYVHEPGRTTQDAASLSNNWHRLPAQQANEAAVMRLIEGPGRGHAAPVEPVSTCQRYAAAIHRVNSAAPAA
jgi:hypothetical protein